MPGTLRNHLLATSGLTREMLGHAISDQFGEIAPPEDSPEYLAFLQTLAADPALAAVYAAQYSDRADTTKLEFPPEITG